MFHVEHVDLDTPRLGLPEGNRRGPAARRLHSVTGFRYGNCSLPVASRETVSIENEVSTIIGNRDKTMFLGHTAPAMTLSIRQKS